VLNDLVVLKPGIFGITFNVNELFRRIIAYAKRKGK